MAGLGLSWLAGFACEDETVHWWVGGYIFLGARSMRTTSVQAPGFA